MTAPYDVEDELWVPEPNSDWERYGGERLDALDAEQAQTLARDKLADLSGQDAVIQTYSRSYDQATRIARANNELRMNKLLERSMGDTPFAPRPQPWRGMASQAMVRSQQLTIATQGRWLTGYRRLTSGGWEHPTMTFTPTAALREFQFDLPPIAYDWNAVTRMISYEGDFKFWRDVQRGQRFADAMTNAVRRLNNLFASIGQVNEQRTMNALLGQDGEVKGWQRMCRPDACPWCCLLSSRGGVYRTFATARYGRRGLYHLPRDRCTARPVFRRYEHLPQLTEAAEARVLYAEALYNESAGRVAGGQDPINPLAAKRLARGEKRRSIFMDEYLYHAYRDPMFRPRPVRTLGRRPTGRTTASL